MLLIAFLYFGLTDCRDCVDSVKGICETNDLFGWCFHDKISGAFDCDSSKFCASQGSLRGRLNSTGCFDRGTDDIKCCCNEADMCNYNFLNVKPTKTVGFQSCIYNYKSDETVIHFKNCFDPWCIAYFKYDIDGNEAILRGCQSRTLKRFKMDRQASAHVANRIYFGDMNDLLEQPRCNQLVDESDSINGTITVCLDLFSKHYSGRKIARLCCCRGKDQCNARIIQENIGKILADLKFAQEMPSRTSSINSLLFVGIFVVFLQITSSLQTY